MSTVDPKDKGNGLNQLASVVSNPRVFHFRQADPKALVVGSAPINEACRLLQVHLKQLFRLPIMARETIENIGRDATTLGLAR